MGQFDDFAGKFIVIDGPDGCGKTTQAKLLSEALEKDGVAVLAAREPGGTYYGTRIRQLLLDKPEEGALPLEPAAEALLFAAARAQLLPLINQKLAMGSAVVLDRYITSTLAYQGFARGLSTKTLLSTLHLSEQQGLRVRPDCMVILDCPVSIARRRLIARGEAPDRIESEGSDFQHRVREGYLQQLGQFERTVLVDASVDSPEVVFTFMTAAIRRQIKQNATEELRESRMDRLSQEAAEIIVQRLRERVESRG